MSNVYKDGVEIICPAVYVSDSAGEALETVAYQLAHEVRQQAGSAYDAYGDGSSSSESDPVDYFSLLDEDDD
jgi:hypothetical protein